MLSVAKLVRPAIIAIAALLCLDAALIGVGWIAASDPPLSIDPVAESSWTPPVLHAPPAAMGDAREIEQNDPVVARPIFFPSRKPYEAPPVSAATPQAAPKPPPPDPIFVIDGIMLTGGARKAHLRQPQELDGQWYKTGQVIDGWTIMQIDAAGIVLEQEERRFAMRLYSSEPGAFQMVGQSSRPKAQ